MEAMLESFQNITKYTCGSFMMELLPYKKSRINFICCLEGMGTRQTSYYQKYQYHGKCLLCTSYYPASSSFNRAVYQKKKKNPQNQATKPTKTYTKPLYYMADQIQGARLYIKFPSLICTTS